MPSFLLVLLSSKKNVTKNIPSSLKHLATGKNIRKEVCRSSLRSHVPPRMPRDFCLILPLSTFEAFVQINSLYPLGYHYATIQFSKHWLFHFMLFNDNVQHLIIRGFSRHFHSSRKPWDSSSTRRSRSF